MGEDNVRLTEEFPANEEQKELTCHRTDCTDKAVVERGFKVKGIEYFLVLCKPCDEELQKNVKLRG